MYGNTSHQVAVFEVNQMIRNTKNQTYIEGNMIQRNL